MFQAIIVEDEKPILELMKVIIGRNANFAIAGAYTNPLEALERLSELRPDVAFLDVEMPKLNGLELAQKIIAISEHTKIVFTTAYKHYAVEAFDVYALDYILKPVTPAAIERVAERLAKPYRSSGSGGPNAERAKIQCFGGFEVRSPEGTLIRFPTRKTEELFAYLLCHPRRDISKWQLADLLWPDMTEERISHNLHNTIYRLKKMLKEHGIGMDIHKSSEGYMLDTGHTDYDVLSYEKHPVAFAEGQPDTELGERLIALYKGPLLNGKPYLWKVPLEEAYGKQYTFLMRLLLSREMAKGEWNKAEQRLGAYLSLYPLDEEMNGMLIDLYASTGEKEKGIRHYKKFAASYRRELGLEPPEPIKERVASWLG
ncbi:response regulator [Paenibacillus ginsengarvi]|uniref:Response regulator n=1 Tax=Paenibacillus ginsengarvi TaxID=400777 RepID=A0A3B0C831_9BACL|nr:response regulator [Paenibacillus ginsengarvi]RKN80648.1 response regulator [Paenibacillus ginsengarvi]